MGAGQGDERDQQGMPTVRPRGSPPGTSIDDSRFTAGTLLAGRYRIVGRLGKGGMGEVYRADDLKLGQSVALKFLPALLGQDPEWLGRFHGEVRIAREIAHPNVCRTYDIAEADGEHFISMEYVDGEDLATLLRRIGRLPKAKAIDIARQLCAGLAAAHDRGVIHRDLKPANVMLDGRGRVRITDFGIAAVAEALEAKDVRAGTPAYMAPEQHAGEAVSVRSDIYSLGLVLYEVFTGREAYEADSVADLTHMRRSSAPSTPSSIVEDMDPLVERVLMRCLEHDPRNRPSSVIAVAAALPGGDPLAMALAAGETPSPEMVAQSGAAGSLKPPVAIACLVAIVALIAVSIVAIDRLSIVNVVPMPKPPSVLTDRAREMLRGLGYRVQIESEAHWFSANGELIAYVERTDESPDRLDRLGRGDLPFIEFTFRSSPEPLYSWEGDGRVSWSQPAFDQPGMTRLVIDPAGRLRSFEVIPPAQSGASAAAQSGASAAAQSGASAEAVSGASAAERALPDWSPLLAAAGLDREALVAAEPQRTPSVYCDSRAAWTGTWPGAQEVALRVEAGAVEGKPTYFRMLGPWSDAEEAEKTAEENAGERLAGYVFVVIGFLAVPLGAASLAWRNLRAGRGDRRGAFRLALYLFIVVAVSWALSARHVLFEEPFAEVEIVTRAFGAAAGMALFAWVLYVAIEPYARRYWPKSLVSWSRLLSGRLRDPMVGRDVLIGCLFGVGWSAVTMAARLVPEWLGATPALPWPWIPDSILGPGHALGAIFSAQSGLGFAMGFFVLFLLLRLICRRNSIAIVVFAILSLATITNLFTASPVEDAGQWVIALMVATFVPFLLVRYGLLAFVVYFLAETFVVPIATFDFSRWYAGLGLIGPLALVAIAVYGFWVALAGQPLFKDELAAAPARRA